MFFFKKKTAGRDTADTPLKRKAKAMPTDYYEINKELYSRILLKFGQRV